MPKRRPDTILSWSVAAALGLAAQVPPLRIQRAARGDLGRGRTGLLALAAVAAHHREHPEDFPKGYVLPADPTASTAPTRPDAPLPPHLARVLAEEAAVDVRTVQRVAAGSTSTAAPSARARSALEAYFRAFPERRPATFSAGSSAPPMAEEARGA